MDDQFIRYAQKDAEYTHKLYLAMEDVRVKQTWRYKLRQFLRKIWRWIKCQWSISMNYLKICRRR